MLEEIENKIRRHSGFKYLILTTVDEVAFYEKCGMRQVCQLNLDNCCRLFYVKNLRERI